MNPKELRDVEFYNTIAEVTSATLEDWNITIRKLESENAFRVTFNSLSGIIEKTYYESFIVDPYAKQILIYHKEHVWPAKLLKKTYKSLTDIDFIIRGAF